jgi:hypothetical protein
MPLLKFRWVGASAARPNADDGHGKMPIYQKKKIFERTEI